jgi:3-oxoacyl-[acyl-carrier-protein] synthase II
LLSPLGIGVEATSEAVRTGRCGLSFGNASEVMGCPFWPDYYGVVRGFDPRIFIEDKKSIRKTTRSIHLAVSAARIAMDDAMWSPKATSDSYSDGVIIAMGVEEGVADFIPVYAASLDRNGRFDYRRCGTDGVAQCPPLYILPRLPNTAAGQIAIINSITGINYSVVNNSNGGAVAIGEAVNNILSSRASRVLTGGCNAPIGVTHSYRQGYFDWFYDLSSRGSVPFSVDRKGVIPSEGAAFLVLEDEASALSRGARIYAEVKGVTNLSNPRPGASVESEANAYARSIENTLNAAGMTPGDITYISASGIGLRLQDAAECRAITKVFGSRAKDVPIAALKAQTGFLETASGSLEAAAAALSIRDNYIPSTARFREGDPDCNLSFCHPAAEQSVRNVLSTSFDIKGGLCSMILSRYEG